MKSSTPARFKPTAVPILVLQGRSLLTHRRLSNDRALPAYSIDPHTRWSSVMRPQRCTPPLKKVGGVLADKMRVFTRLPLQCFPVNISVLRRANLWHEYECARYNWWSCSPRPRDGRIRLWQHTPERQPCSERCGRKTAEGHENGNYHLRRRVRGEPRQQRRSI